MQAFQSTFAQMKAKFNHVPLLQGTRSILYIFCGDKYSEAAFAPLQVLIMSGLGCNCCSVRYLLRLKAPWQIPPLRATLQASAVTGGRQSQCFKVGGVWIFKIAHMNWIFSLFKMYSIWKVHAQTFSNIRNWPNIQQKWQNKIRSV